MRKLHIAIGLAALIAFTAAAPASARSDNRPEPRTIDVQLLAFNDFHGNLLPPPGGVIRTSNNPVTSVPAGGVEYFATHMKTLEAENPKNTLIVSGGDMIGASPLLSGLFHDEPTIEAMNLIGVDYNGVGNHEFDEGKAELLRMQNGGCHPVDGCQDGTPFFGSVFQFLAANVIDNSTNNPLLPAFKIERIQGVKVAFIGETLEGTPLIVTPAGVQGLTFLDEADTVNMLVPRLREKGVETIVLLLHEGGFQTGDWLYNGCTGFGGDVVDIVNRLDDEVDVVVSGHTHQPYNCTLDGKLVTSASSFGRIITDIDLGIDRKTGEVVSKTADNVIVTQTVAKDPAQTALIDHYNAIAGPIANRIVGRITADITRTANLAGESALGDVIADAQLAATAPTDFGGAKIAFMNPGGIRADMPFAFQAGGEAAGEITYGELFTVQPFGNTLVVKTCTGTQIEQLLEQQWQVLASGRFLQISAGFEYTWDASKPIGDRVDPASIKLDGVTLDPSTGYRVEMNSFLASGGDGFSVFNACTNQLGGEVDLDALVRYFMENSPVAPGPQNRIKRLN
jgi:5'-nucleotidase